MMNWDHLTGFWEADGSCWFKSTDTQLVHYIGFYSTDREIIESIDEFLKAHGIGLNITLQSFKESKERKIRYSVTIREHKETLLLAGELIKRVLIERKKKILIDIVEGIRNRRWRGDMPSKEELETAYRKGQSYAKVAEVYGVSSVTVGKWIKKLGIKKGDIID